MALATVGSRRAQAAMPLTKPPPVSRSQPMAESFISQ